MLTILPLSLVLTQTLSVSSGYEHHRAYAAIRFNRCQKTKRDLGSVDFVVKVVCEWTHPPHLY
jgi:hypothetical protein